MIYTCLIIFVIWSDKRHPVGQKPSRGCMSTISVNGGPADTTVTDGPKETTETTETAVSSCLGCGLKMFGQVAKCQNWHPYSHPRCKSRSCGSSLLGGTGSLETARGYQCGRSRSEAQVWKLFRRTGIRYYPTMFPPDSCHRSYFCFELEESVGHDLSNYVSKLTSACTDTLEQTEYIEKFTPWL